MRGVVSRSRSSELYDRIPISLRILNQPLFSCASSIPDSCESCVFGLYHSVASEGLGFQSSYYRVSQ